MVSHSYLSITINGNLFLVYPLIYVHESKREISFYGTMVTIVDCDGVEYDHTHLLANNDNNNENHHLYDYLNYI